MRLNCSWFYIKINYIFAVNRPEKLNLTDDERKILDELDKGKMQKQIDLWSEQTVSAKIKAARERNLCDNTNDLLIKYRIEKQTLSD